MNYGDELNRLLGELVGRQIVGIIVGPAGVHVDFAAATAPELIRHSFFSNARISILKREGIVAFLTGPFPPFDHKTRLEEHLLGCKVTNVAFDANKHAARLELDGEKMLSFVPTNDERVDWSLSYFPDAPDLRKSDGFIVSATGILPKTHSPFKKS